MTEEIKPKKIETHDYITIDGKEPEPAISFFQTKRFKTIGYSAAVLCGILTYLLLTLL